MSEYLNDADFLSLFDETASPNTLRTYSYVYKAILRDFDIESIYDLFENNDYDDIEKYLLDMPKANTAQMYLSLIKKIFDKDEIPKQLYDLDYTLRDLIRENKNVSNIALIKRLPKYETILKKLREIKDPRRYIINFLLIKMNCRNLDLQLKIVFSFKNATDKNINYLIVGNSSIIFVRNVYKTVATYGVKMNKLSNLRFRNAVAEYTQGQEKYLFPMKNGEPISNRKLGDYVVRSTIDGHTETELFKIYIDYIDRKGSINMLIQASKRRGTNYQSLIEDYHMKINHKDIKINRKGKDKK